MNRVLAEAAGRALGSPVTALQPVSGGDIHQAFAATLEDGRRVFLKHHHSPPPGIFAAEAQGLRWLAEAEALRVPRVLAATDGPPSFLALELIEAGSKAPGFDEALGRGLAALHRFGAPTFGLDHPNFIGPLPQDNTPAASWADFYRDRRLLPRIREAEARGLLPRALRGRLGTLLDRLPALVGPSEPPARLHGDLWGGNLLVDEAGAPVLIDPAVHGGHREVDLAMMRLFGGFGPRVFGAYAEAFPLAEGAAGRVALYQLHPLLVHLVLFGRGYLAGVERAVGRYA